MKNLRLFLVLSLLILFFSCATTPFIEGISFSSTPEGADVVIYDSTGEIIYKGNTIGFKMVSLKGTPPFKGEYTLTGYKQETIEIKNGDNGWTWNFVNNSRVYELGKNIGIKMQKSEETLAAEAEAKRKAEEVYYNPVFIGTNAALAREFSANSAAARQKYENKIIRINGNIERIDINGQNGYILRIDGMRCYFDSNDLPQDRMIELKVGQTISVTGNLFENFQLLNGVLIPGSLEWVLRKCRLINP